MDKPPEIQKKGQWEEAGFADRGEEPQMVLAFFQTLGWKFAVEGRRMVAEGDPGRGGEELSGMNNGCRILRDLVKTLIMDQTQLERPEEQRGPSRKF